MCGVVLRVQLHVGYMWHAVACVERRVSHSKPPPVPGGLYRAPRIPQLCTLTPKSGDVLKVPQKILLAIEDRKHKTPHFLLKLKAYIWIGVQTKLHMHVNTHLISLFR